MIQNYQAYYSNQKRLRSEQLKIYSQERKLLRMELNNLKDCQLKYFTFSLTATGIIFGLIVKFGDFQSILFLLPLTVLIPSWLVFFDKTKTITRIVAYYMLLETLILHGENFFKSIMIQRKKYIYILDGKILFFFREWELMVDNFEKKLNESADELAMAEHQLKMIQLIWRS